MCAEYFIKVNCSLFCTLPKLFRKQISSSNIRSKESNEKIIDGTILKRNSSKTSKCNSIPATKVGFLIWRSCV